MMKTVYLVRHAQSESNAGIAIRPNHLISLTEQGQKQAQDLAQWLVENVPVPKQVFVSKFIRTQQTAQPYLEQISQESCVLDDLFEFNYLDFKTIEHLTHQQLRQKALDFWQKNDIFYQDSEQSDSFVHFVQRVKNVRQSLEHLPDGNYVVFTHGTWLGMLIWQLLQLNDDKILNMQQFLNFEFAIRPKNCDVFMLQYTQHNQSMLSKIRANMDQIENLGEPKANVQLFTTK